MPLINLEFGIDSSGRLTVTPATPEVLGSSKAGFTGQTPLIQHFHMTPCPPGELIADDGLAVGPLSGDCGPAEVSAGPLWGAWDIDEKKARQLAISRVRDACSDQCAGGCADKKSCAVLITKSAILDVESRTNPTTNQIEFRAKATASGKCQCE